MNERRKTKRFSEKNVAVIHYSVEKNSSCRDSNQAWTQDISVDGAQLLTYKSFPLDTKLIVSLDLPKSEQIVKLWARVVWTRNSSKKGEYEVGVEFIHSLQTRHDLFRHLYGYRTQTKKKRPVKKNNSIPVEATEI